MKDVERHICEVLEAAGLGVLGTDLFMGPVRDSKGVPDDAIFVHLYSGTATPFLGGRDATDLHRDRVQIRVRDQTKQEGSELAYLVWLEIHKGDRPTDGYISWLSDKPTYFDRDKKGRHEWSVNMIATYEE